MARINRQQQLNIRRQARSFLGEHDFVRPPLSPGEALAARRLEVSAQPLDDLLVRANLPHEEAVKVQAMLEMSERVVVFQDRLGKQRRNWGAMHEVGHEYLPWQRELLYACPLLMLPERLQKEFEAEADSFAAEAFFFGDQFTHDARQGDFGLVTAMQLADDVYGTSYHASFARYVEENEIPCCLLVWKPSKNGTDIWRPMAQLKIQYYVPSKSFKGHIEPGQIADPDDAVSRLFGDPKLDGILTHSMSMVTDEGKSIEVAAESFSNSYTVFTLLRMPERG